MLIIAIVASELGKAVSKETRVDILVTPLVTIFSGVGLSMLIAAPIGAAASQVGTLIMWATEQAPLVMGILVSVIVGVALTLPISSAAICAALGLTGLAGGRGRLLRPDDRLCRDELQGERRGRSGQSGPWHQHAADGQHRQEPPYLDRTHAGQCHHRPAGYLRVPL